MGWDKDMSYVTAGFQQISTAALGVGVHETISINDIIADHDGYILTYLSNENNEAVNIHWDDFTIYHGKTNVVSTQDYYPFGLTFNESVRVASEPNNFKYNSFEYMEDLNLNLYDYQARYYDPAIGRFINVDPAADLMRSNSPFNYAFNNPIRFIDPDGMMPSDTVKDNSGSSSQALVTTPPLVAPTVLPLRGLGIWGALLYYASGQAAADAMGNSELGTEKSYEAKPYGDPRNDADWDKQNRKDYETLSRKNPNDLSSQEKKRLAWLEQEYGGETRWDIQGHNPGDQDMRGTGISFNKALDMAFENIGIPRDEFDVIKAARAKDGTLIPTEYRGPNGAEVSVDYPHSSEGPDIPHIGWTVGKRAERRKGHILLDDVPVGRPQR